MGAGQEEVKAASAGGKQQQELLRGRCLPGALLQPLQLSDLGAEEGPTSAKQEGMARLARRGPRSPQDSSES